MATPADALNDLWSISNSVEKIKSSTNGDEDDRSGSWHDSFDSMHDMWLISWLVRFDAVSAA